MIPFFLSIDVEPDTFQLPRHGAPPRWDGFEAMLAFSERLRFALLAASGEPPRFGWYVRTDPQIADVYGRADHLLRAEARAFDLLARRDDYFGVHAHPIRWSEAHEAFVHDVSDPAWLRHSTAFALDAFAGWAGAPARRFRFGAGFLSDDVVTTLEEHGVELDLTLEPVAGWALSATEVATSVDDTPLVGRYVDCRGAPRAPYRPARADFRVADAAGRRLILIPLTTVSRPDGGVEMAYPALDWPSADGFWDRVERELRSMARPYLSFAVRTDAREARATRRVCRILEGLARHRLARRLRFTDPAEVAATLH